MTDVAHQKVNAGHLKRNAYLYVRQSTPRQVLENALQGGEVVGGKRNGHKALATHRRPGTKAQTAQVRNIGAGERLVSNGGSINSSCSLRSRNTCRMRARPR